MTEDDFKKLSHDPDGLLTYEYLANNIGECTPDVLDRIVENMKKVDLSARVPD